MEIFETSPLSDFRPVKGEGCWLWDDAGKRYLDLLGGTWCNVLGAGHPRFTKAVVAQAERLVHTGSGVVSDTVRDAANCLGSVLPGYLNRMTFLNTGSEAVEFAIKAARIATGRFEIIGFRLGYYGATGNALALSETGRGATYLNKGSEVPPIPAPTCYRCPLNKEYPSCEYACLTEWQTEAENYHERVAAFLFEPVQGRAVIVPPPGYLSALEKIADRWGSLMISEEVTTGTGRTGYWFGFQRDNLSPDILVLGKALGNGLPVAAVVGTSEVERKCAGRLVHVQSHQNDPFSGAIAAEVINIIRDEGLVERARELGAYFLDGLERIRSKFTGVRDARGLGLMAALELGGQNAEERGVVIQRRLRAEGIIVDFNRPVASFRFFPPYVVTESQLDLTLEALASGIRDTAEEPHG